MADETAALPVDRNGIADLIVARMRAEASALAQEFRQEGRICSFTIDDVLPRSIADRLAQAFPAAKDMIEYRSLREHKFASAQMDRHVPILEEVLFAFQADAVLSLLKEITGIPELDADPQLYAGGVSRMDHGNFLNPHLDNSHDNERQRYRVLNLLYYVSPDWNLEDGGNLELWDGGLKQPPRIIHSRFNRLVCMATDRRSWHSVQRVTAHRSRFCISNYYFSPTPLTTSEYFHVTSFRGRPEEPIRDAMLQADVLLRQGVRKLFPKGVRENPLLYRDKKPPS
jgi:Rps23 Pro-64 3,4-dihydroxylase Tpa1-like proline 4-hydroxylase